MVIASSPTPFKGALARSLGDIVSQYGKLQTNLSRLQQALRSQGVMVELEPTKEPENLLRQVKTDVLNHSLHTNGIDPNNFDQVNRVLTELNADSGPHPRSWRKFFYDEGLRFNVGLDATYPIETLIRQYFDKIKAKKGSREKLIKNLFSLLTLEKHCFDPSIIQDSEESKAVLAQKVFTSSLDASIFNSPDLSKFISNGDKSKLTLFYEILHRNSYPIMRHLLKELLTDEKRDDFIDMASKLFRVNAIFKQNIGTNEYAINKILELLDQFYDSESNQGFLSFIDDQNIVGLSKFYSNQSNEVAKILIVHALEPSKSYSGRFATFPFQVSGVVKDNFGHDNLKSIFPKIYTLITGQKLSNEATNLVISDFEDGKGFLQQVLDGYTTTFEDYMNTVSSDAYRENLKPKVKELLEKDNNFARLVFKAIMDGFDESSSSPGRTKAIVEGLDQARELFLELNLSL